LWEKFESVLYAINPHDLEALEKILVKKFTTFSNVKCNKFPEICLREFRHVSQQRTDILNTFYDGEDNINYYT
jgi:hypothetical protein